MGENSTAKQDTNMNIRKLHTKASSNDTQPSSFSFGIAGSTSQLTPYFVRGNLKDTTKKIAKIRNLATDNYKDKNIQVNK